ncbi:ABC transporter substrate-binding protein [Paenochrobactrum glaciei]|uniref:ABC transporter substrate-binding protein n=1 Tax=Paenochrobactrum glaciei TaxID=486407 RepID=A0ABP3RX47_9HYPH
MKKTLALALLMSSTVFSATGAVSAAEPGWISISACVPAAPLIPTNTNERCGSDVLQPILAGLVSVDPKTGKVLMDIATSIETDDNINWTVTVAKDRVFHDGTPVTAKSFVDAWNWAAYAPNGQTNNNWFTDIEGYEALSPSKVDGATPEPTSTEMTGLKLIDDNSFSIKLKAPLPSFISKLTYKAFFPMPEAFFADTMAYAKKPIGAGPFMFESGSADSGFRLAAFEGYTGPFKPSLKGIEQRIYTNGEAAYNDLVAGNLDMMRDVPVSKLVGEQWKRDLEDRTLLFPTGATMALGMPYTDANKQLLNPELRQALSMAIDREAIIEIIMNGTAVAATGWVPPAADGYVADGCGDTCKFNPEKAKELYDAAGGYEGDIKLYYSAESNLKPMMEAVCNSIQNTLDVTCLPQSLSDNSTFSSLTRSGKIDGVYPANWSLDYPAIDNALIPVYSINGTSNRGQYANDAFEKLIEEASYKKQEEAFEIYQQAEKLLAVDLPRVPLWHPKVAVGYSPRVAEIVLFSNGRPDYTRISLK